MYDPNYELRGQDYPIGHVRWTAQRNMQAFLELVSQGKLNVGHIITHRFPFDDAERVFDQIASGELGSAVGVVLEFAGMDLSVPTPAARTRQYASITTAGPVRLAVIGIGNYCKSVLLPNIKEIPGVSLQAIGATKGAGVDELARRYHCQFATTDVEQIFASSDINAVLIATRHDSHAELARHALQAGKHTYVEKPLALTDEQLDAILAVLPPEQSGGPAFWVGYNRRFSPLSQALFEHFSGVEVRQVHCQIHAAPVPAESWYQDAAEGGGILFGDVCHFIDLALFFAHSQPREVNAMATHDPSHQNDSWTIQIGFQNGGLASVRYICGSNRGYVREVITVVGGGRSAQLEGFRKLTLRGAGRTQRIRRLQPDLGQRRMLQAAFARFQGSSDQPDLSASFVLSTQVLLATHRSIIERRAITLEPVYPFRVVFQMWT
jgi:predicted dehydrogenase